MDEPGSRRGSALSGASGKALGKAPGRAHDAEGARQAILNAAEEVFAEHGFDGARVDLIAARSGYNKSLIFQYFGDKLNLYASVIREADERTRAMQNRMLARLVEGEDLNTPEQLRALLKSFMTEYFDYMVEHPNFLRIMNWEMAEGWQTYAKILTERDFQDIVDFVPPMQKIQETGWLRSNIEPLSQITIALFTNQIFLGLLPFFKIMLPDFHAESPERLAQMREFTAEFIANGLIIGPGEAKT